MKRSWISPIVIWFVVCSFCAYGRLPQAGAEERLTYIDLINRLIDLEHLATLPAPWEKCAQWSSYDRRSKYDETSGKYIDWSANRDGTGIIREEGNRQVFAEIEGPGVIWRIWSALAKEGHVKIYLDGAEEPAVDLPFIGYFNRENEPFTYPSLVHMTARGQNCYVPIPFQKSCKITAEGDWGRYYHFTYTTYPKGTILPTFERNLSLAESEALNKANQILARCGLDPAGQRPGQATIEQEGMTVAPGSTVTVARLRGKRAITALKVSMDLPESPEDRDVLRELVLSIYWDGESRPSVWVPLGDFFGTAAGVNKYKSLPLGMTNEGFYCYWYMPFEKSALIKLTNDGDKKRTAVYLPQDPSYTIFYSVRDSVRFAERTLIPYKGHLCCKSSFVDEQGNVMGWHDFGNLEGPGWAANAVGGAYEIYMFARHIRDPSLEKKAISLLEHVLENGFIDYETGFITGYRETTTDKFCLNYQHKNNWFCPGSMAKVAYQILLFSDQLDGERRHKMRSAAVKTAEWLNTNVKSTSNGWFPRRCDVSGKHYPKNAYAVAFRVLREAAKLLGEKTILDFAYEKCLGGLDQFKMKEDRNGVQTKGLLFMEKSWDTAYLWENAEATLAYIEAYIDTNNKSYLADGLTILRAIAKHHHGPYGFLTEGVDWNNHVGKQHHFNQAEYGDIKYSEPLLNNLHIVEPTLLVIKLEGSVGNA